MDGGDADVFRDGRRDREDAEHAHEGVGKPPVPGSEDELDTSTLAEYVERAEAMRCSYLNVYPEDALKATRGTATFDPAWEEALARAARVLGKNASWPRR